MQTSARELACFETKRPVHTTDGMYPHISPRMTTLPTSTSTPQPLLAEVKISMRLHRRELRQRKRNRSKGNRRLLDHVASTRGWIITLKAFGSPTIVASFVGAHACPLLESIFLEYGCMSVLSLQLADLCHRYKRALVHCRVCGMCMYVCNWQIFVTI